jgi:ribonuclease P protein component
MTAFFISKKLKTLKNFSFPKKEKLCSNTIIEDLFASGEAFLVFPYRVVYKFYPKSNVPVQVAFGVKKKSFKRANKRNRLKRLMRESYRLQKENLCNTLNEQERSLSAFISFVGKEELNFDVMYAKLNKILEILLFKAQNENFTTNENKQATDK